MNASQRTDKASAAGNAYLEIQTAARQARLVDLDHMSVKDARQLLAELTARRDEQNKTAEPFSPAAYRRARKNISKGGQSYSIDANRSAS